MEEEFASKAARITTKISQVAPAAAAAAAEEEHDRGGGGGGELMVVRPSSAVAAAAAGYCSAAPVRLTVWCKSLLFNGNGYTVYDDADGRMVFRVDNYAHDWRREMVLMGSAGNVLLTIRRCRPLILNWRESWEAYQGGDHNYKKLMPRDGGINDADGGEVEVEEEELMTKQMRRRPVFKATKELGSRTCSIYMLAGAGAAAGNFDYRMNWSRQKDQSSIICRQAAASNTLVAEVSRKFGSMEKRMLDSDVLTLRVQPGMDQALAMAMLMVTNSMRC